MVPLFLDPGVTIRAAAYVRVSTGAQAEKGLSLGEQKRRCEERIAREGWEHIDTFVEAGVSARAESRPELQRLRSMLAQLDVLVIPKLDRLARSMQDFSLLYRELADANVALVSLSETIDTTTAGGKLQLHILSAFAEFESDTIGERVSASMPARVREGRHLGAAVYGYRRDGKGSLVPVPAEAAVVRRIFSEFAAGKSMNAIQRGLNADGLRPKRAKRWQQIAISRILRNPVYKGNVRYRGEDYPGAHEAIVESALWAGAADLLAARSSTRAKGRGRPPERRHLFTHGLLRCGRCGEAMIPRGDHYRCLGRTTQGPEYCTRTPVPRAPLDTAVFAYFQKVGVDVAATRRAMEKNLEHRTDELRAMISQAETELRQASERLDRVRRAFQDGRIESDDWREQRPELLGERAAAEAALDRLRTQERTLDDAETALGREKDVLGLLSEIRRAIAADVGARPELAAVRAGLVRLFESFTLHSSTSDYATATFRRQPDGLILFRSELMVPFGDERCLPPSYLYIEPHPRRAAIVELSALRGPILRKEALSLAADNRTEVCR